MKVGDKIRRTIKVSDLDNHLSSMIEVEADAIVEWIHPERRFFTIRVLLPSGKSFRTTDYFYPKKADSI